MNAYAPESDSGDSADLTKISIKENIVGLVATDMVQFYDVPAANPNYVLLGPGIQILAQLEDFVGLQRVFDGATLNEAAAAGGKYYYDLFTAAVTQTAKTSGVITNTQYFTFHDDRTDYTGNIPKSGFKHTVTVSKEGVSKFKVVVKKQSAAYGLLVGGTMTAAAQVAQTVYITKP